MAQHSEFGTKVGCRRAREQVGAHAVVMVIAADTSSSTASGRDCIDLGREAAGPKG